MHILSYYLLVGFQYAVATRANKGNGLEICRQLASDGVMVLLTDRDEKRGLEAVAKLHESSLSNVLFLRLDVMDGISIASLEKFIVTNNGKLDIFVSNQHLLENLFTHFPSSEKKGIFGVFARIQKNKKKGWGEDTWEFKLFIYFFNR